MDSRWLPGSRCSDPKIPVEWPHRSGHAEAGIVDRGAGASRTAQVVGPISGTRLGELCKPVREAARDTPFIPLLQGQANACKSTHQITLLPDEEDNQADKCLCSRN